jgi:hypothetical protein
MTGVKEKCRIGAMGTQKNRRKSPRARVYVDVSFRLACGSVHTGKIINLSKDGAFITVAEPVGSKERVAVQFSLPGISAPMGLEGEVIWSRSNIRTEPKLEIDNVLGVKFVNITETYGRLIKNYIRKANYMDSQVRSFGIVQVMGKIRSLPPANRLKAYDFLIKSGYAHLEC